MEALVFWRAFLALFCVATLTACNSARIETTVPTETAYAGEQFPVRLVDRSKFDKSYWPKDVVNETGLPAGTILIDTESNFLYLVKSDAVARRYRIAVGAAGKAWKGEAVVARKSKWPVWHPTDNMHAEAPGLPQRIEPGPHNPLGARALYLYRDGRDTLYRIHGTSEPWTIGTKASSGCIRLFNEDVIELFDQVPEGTRVIVH